jgi:hypothetical protein
MEIPIRIVIVLFVALIVGLSIIQFSRETITDAKKNIMKYNRDKGVEEEKVLDMGSISEQDIVNLAEECYKQESSGNVDKKLCFVLHGKVTTDSANLNNSFKSMKEPLNLTYVPDEIEDKNALFIYYNPEGKIEVRT